MSLIDPTLADSEAKTDFSSLSSNGVKCFIKRAGPIAFIIKFFLTNSNSIFFKLFSGITLFSCKMPVASKNIDIGLFFFFTNSIASKIVFSLLKSIDGVVLVPIFSISEKPILLISLAIDSPIAPVPPTITAKLFLFIKKRPQVILRPFLK